MQNPKKKVIQMDDPEIFESIPAGMEKVLTWIKFLEMPGFDHINHCWMRYLHYSSGKGSRSTIATIC